MAFNSLKKLIFFFAFMSVSSAGADVLWTDNNISKTDENIAGGGLNINAENDNTYNNIEPDNTISKNTITVTKDVTPINEQLSAQGAALYISGQINKINADFSENKATIQYNQAGNALAAGGAIALYSGATVNNLYGDFVSNSVQALYTGTNESSSYSGDSLLSAVGGAIYINGSISPTEPDTTITTKIGNIYGSFVSNSASADAYAAGGAIYIDAAENVNAGFTRLNGNFTNNAVVAKTADSSVEASTGGAISLNSQTSNSGSPMLVFGDFTGNSVTTNATNAFGGAIYNEGTITVSGDFTNNIVKSQTGNAFGGAFYNAGNASIANSVVSGNSAEQGGAIYNDVNAVFKLQNVAFSNNKAGDQFNDIYNLGTLTIDNGTTTLSGGITGSGKLVVNVDKRTSAVGVLDIGTSTVSQSDLTLNGTIYLSALDENNYGKLNIANTIEVGNSGKLAILVLNSGTYELFSNSVIDISNISAGGGLFSVTDAGSGAYSIQLKDTEGIINDTGLSDSSVSILTGLLMNSSNADIAGMSLSAQQLLEEGDIDFVQQEVNKLLPEDFITLSLSMNIQNQIIGLTKNRVGQSYFLNKNADKKSELGLWAQGTYNKTDITGNITGQATGIAVGADIKLYKKLLIGLGYNFNLSEYNATGRDTEVQTHSIFLYSQYKPSSWYLSAIAGYSFSDYEENISVFGTPLTDNYKSDFISGQIASGYDFSSGFTPEVAIRYIRINQTDYSNDLFGIDNTSFDYLTGLAGLKYTFLFETGTTTLLWPELSAAVKYDILSDNTGYAVSMNNGSPFSVSADNLSPLGAELSLGLTAEYKSLKVSLNYMLDIREEYKSQSGMLKFKYDF